MTWRTPRPRRPAGLFIPRLVTWDPATGEFACVEGPKGFATWEEAEEAGRFSRLREKNPTRGGQMGMTPTFLRQFVAQYVGGLRDALQFVGSSQSHHDAMLTWSIGLMGAGVFSAYSLLPTHARALVLAPWILGILFAITGRLVARIVRDKDEFANFAKIAAVSSLLLTPTAPEVPASIMKVINNEDDFGKRRTEVDRLNRYSTALGLSAHILFAVGVVAVFWALS